MYSLARFQFLNGCIFFWLIITRSSCSSKIARQGLDYNYENWENETSFDLFEDQMHGVTKPYNLTTQISEDPLLLEIREMKDQVGGYMSAGLVVLLRSIVEAQEETVLMIMHSLYTEVHRAEEDGRLDELGEYLIEYVRQLTDMLKRRENEPQAQAYYCMKAIEKRKRLHQDLKNVMEKGNALYSEKDMLSLIPIVRAIQNYPKEGHGREIAVKFVEMVTRKLYFLTNTTNGEQFLDELRHVINIKNPQTVLRRGNNVTKKLLHQRTGLDYEYENWEKDQTTEYLIPGMKTTKPYPGNWTTPIVASVQEIREEIKSMSDEADIGLFTASLMVLLNTYHKLDNDLSTTAFHRALEAQLAVFNSKKAFDIFGPLMHNVIYAFIVKLSDAETETIIETAKNISSTLKKRDAVVLHDLNAILNVADSIFDNDDVDHVIDVIRNILLFPASQKSHYEIVDDALKAFIFRPCERINGTQTEKYLLKLVTNSLEKRFKKSSIIEVQQDNPVVVNSTEMHHTESDKDLDYEV